MDNAALVGIIDGAECVAAPAQGVLFGDSSTPGQNIGQTPAWEVFFDNAISVVVVDAVVDSGQMRVAELLQDPDALDEVVHQWLVGSQRLAQPLHDRLGAVILVVGEINHRQIAFTDSFSMM